MAGPRRDLAFGERGRFLRALAELGEVKAAARVCGLPSHFLYRVRGRDAGFAGAWDEALASRAVVERGRGRVQRKTVTRRQWTRAYAEQAVEVAAQTGSLKSVAARTGFCADTIRKARRGSPGFDAAIREALADATVRLEAELLDRASSAMCFDGLSTNGVGEEAGAGPVRFAEALDLVKHRRAVEAREARALLHGRGRFAERPSMEDVRDRVKARLAALRRAREVTHEAERGEP